MAPHAIGLNARARVVFDFDYDGGGFGKGGLVSISIDGAKVAERRIERTITTPDPHSETFDIGIDSGVPVVETPGRSNAFTGLLDKLTFDLGPIGRKRP